MRIAQIAPLYEAVPPKLYGGTERVVSYLTEALVDLGHDVTLFASGDSVTSARPSRRLQRSALRLDPSIRDSMAPHMLLEKVARVAHEFDVLHFHLDYLPFLLMSRPRHAVRDDAARPPRPAGTAAGVRCVPGFAGRVDLEQPAQAVAAGRAGSTVYHGLPDTLLTPQPGVKPEYPRSSAGSARKSASTPRSGSPRKAGCR